MPHTCSIFTSVHITEAHLTLTNHSKRFFVDIETHFLILLSDPQCRYAGIFWHPLGHVLCLHQRLVADQRASAAGLHWWRPALRQEAPRDRMRPKHPWQPGPHRPALSRCPRERGHMSPSTQVRGRSVSDGLSRKYSVASVWACGYYTVPGDQRAEDWYLVRNVMLSGDNGDIHTRSSLYAVVHKLAHPRSAFIVALKVKGANPTPQASSRGTNPNSTVKHVVVELL